MAQHRLVDSTSGLTPDGIAGYTKAIYTAAVTFLGALGTALADGHIDAVEWIGIIGVTIIAAGGVYGLANKVQPVTVVDGAMGDGDDGGAAPGPLMGVVDPPEPPGPAHPPVM